ncbi:MAG: hypothetical protein EOP62_14385 [Sphingomonadales bacterium]|nr:MAG: hypothetical protein EOP62_14385 [Sphingomonadales bacterium]
MKLSLILEARDQASRAVGGLRRAVGGLNRDARSASAGLVTTARSMIRTEQAAERLGRAAYRTGHALGSMTRRGIGGLVALERRLTLSRSHLERFASWTGRKIGEGLRFGALSAIGAGSFALYKVAGAGMNFEKYRTQLEGLEGGKVGGNKAMGWVIDFARQTPYEIGDVMQAFIALKAYGIDPTNGSLKTLGDTAGGMGKTIMQAVEMMADAQTGEFEWLKEFGIRAAQQGDKVTFRFMRNGQEMTRSVKKDGAAIQAALMEIFNERFAGGMDRLAQTTEGKWSNLMDRLTFSAKRVWEGGLGESVNRVLDQLGGALDRAEGDGSLKRWAEQTGTALGDFVQKVGEFDWSGFAGDIAILAKTLSDLAGGLNSAGTALDRVGGYARQAGLKGSLYNPFIGDETKKKNREELRGLNRKLGYDENWGIPADQSARDRSAEQRGLNEKAGRDYWARRQAGKVPAMPWERQRLAPTPSWGGGARRSPWSPGTTTPKPTPPPTGKISLHVTTDRGTQVTQTGMQASGVRIETNIRRGPAMGGFA